MHSVTCISWVAGPAFALAGVPARGSVRTPVAVVLANTCCLSRHCCAGLALRGAGSVRARVRAIPRVEKAHAFVGIFSVVGIFGTATICRCRRAGPAATPQLSFEAVLVGLEALSHAQHARSGLGSWLMFCSCLALQSWTYGTSLRRSCAQHVAIPLLPLYTCKHPATTTPFSSYPTNSLPQNSGQVSAEERATGAARRRPPLRRRLLARLASREEESHAGRLSTSPS
jgi:hypothetical protein